MRKRKEFFINPMKKEQRERSKSCHEHTAHVRGANKQDAAQQASSMQGATMPESVRQSWHTAQRKEKERFVAALSFMYSSRSSGTFLSPPFVVLYRNRCSEEHGVFLGGNGHSQYPHICLFTQWFVHPSVKTGVSVTNQGFLHRQTFVLVSSTNYTQCLFPVLLWGGPYGPGIWRIERGTIQSQSRQLDIITTWTHPRQLGDVRSYAGL